MKLMALLGVLGMALAVATVLVDPFDTPVRIWVAMAGMFGASCCALGLALEHRGARPPRAPRPRGS